MIWAFCINSLIFGNNIAKGGCIMKKINRFLMIYMVVITVLCICMCYLAFSANEKKDNLKEVRSQITTTAEKKQTKAVKKVKATYSLKILDGSLAVINNKTKEVFEYTDMKKENLPADIKNMLKENFIFENREEVYHFLESYSS